MVASGVVRTNTILDKIVARKVEEIAELPATFAARSTPLRDFVGALRRDTVALIAEVKHASPSKGVLIEPFDPVALASEYERGGAAAISVLTDRDFFQGSLDDLRAVRAQIGIPALRKDFIIDARQIDEAYGAGADAILLIVAILDDVKLRDLAQYAAARGLAALIEVHTEDEMERALKIGPRLVGINNRDLHTFNVDLEVTTRLAKLCPSGVTLVAESGIFTVEHVERVATAGAHAILVGESIVKSPDIGAQVGLLSSVRR
jgi:indole-3-glycerol phosphate synthase